MLQRPDNVLVIGKSGSGKTRHVLARTAGCDRILFYDTLGHDYSQGVVVYDLAGLKAYWRRVYRGAFRIIYRPKNDREEFDQVAQLVYDCGNVTFVVEECDSFCRPQQVSPAVWQILKRGRHRDIHTVMVTQRPFGIDRTITSQASQVAVFRTEEPRDLAYLEERLGKDSAEKISQLQQYQYVLWQGFGSPVEVRKDEYN
jgi:hypothetical protein